MRSFEIIPVRLGGRIAESSLFLLFTDAGTKLQIDYRLWVLRSKDRTLLVDTGPPLAEAHRRGITDIQALTEPLAQLGVDPAAIDTVILTHLHWDHASNADAFPQATFLAQRAELQFFRDPHRALSCFDRFFSNHDELGRLIDAGRIQSLPGHCAVEDGIEVMHVGGHTPGSQMVRVRTDNGWALLTGDAVPLNRNFIERIPSGICSNLFEATDALERAHAVRPVALYTGHDPQEVLRVD
jgi:glyoxylase-like metal-dependent hydrolase (beta-lactamase superfamily II)